MDLTLHRSSLLSSTIHDLYMSTCSACSRPRSHALVHCCTAVFPHLSSLSTCMPLPDVHPHAHAHTRICIGMYADMVVSREVTGREVAAEHQHAQGNIHMFYIYTRIYLVYTVTIYIYTYIHHIHIPVCTVIKKRKNNSSGERRSSHLATILY
jgi:hypothetical protein